MTTNIWKKAHVIAFYVVMFFLASVLATAVGMVLVSAWAGAGPHCPGADPAWMGWCSEAPQVAK